MDPRDRERAERRLIAALPSPETPPQPLDPETERRLAWFIQNRKAVMDELGLAELTVTPMGIEAVRKPVMPVLTVVREMAVA
jgi:hypothetical protein